MKDLAGNVKVDPSRIFEKKFLDRPVHITSAVLKKLENGRVEPLPQIHRDVRHIFIMAKPYNEYAEEYQPRFNICTADQEKNNTVIQYLKKSIGNDIGTAKTTLIFCERVTDVESLFKIIYNREKEFNPNFDQLGFGSREDKFERIGKGRNSGHRSLMNSKYSIVAKLCSSNSGNDREAVMNLLKQATRAKIPKLVLISTNMCAKGLDLPNVDMIINYMLPEWHDGKALMGLGQSDNDFVYR